MVTRGIGWSGFFPTTTACGCPERATPWSRSATPAAFPTSAGSWLHLIQFPSVFPRPTRTSRYCASRFLLTDFVQYASERKRAHEQINPTHLCAGDSGTWRGCAGGQLGATAGGGGRQRRL